MHQGRQQYASQKQKGMLWIALNIYMFINICEYGKSNSDVFDVVFISIFRQK